LKRKLNFTEANYLLLTINEKLKQMDEYREMVSVSSDFESMLIRFTSDGVLDEKEYSMLLEFLEGMRSNLSAKIYNNLRERIADLYRKSRAKSDI